jgi:hypothetical protein
MRTYWFAGLLALLAHVTHACEPMPFHPTMHAAKAEFLVIGYVAGERYPDYEERVLSGGDPEEIEMWGERSLRVIVVESLRGQVGKIIEAPAPCGGPYPGTFKRVVVSKGTDGYVRVFGAEHYEKQARAALKDGL